MSVRSSGSGRKVGSMISRMNRCRYVFLKCWWLSWVIGRVFEV